MKDISKLLDEKLEKLFNKDNRVPENQPPKRFEANPHQNNNDSQKRYGSRNREIRCYYCNEIGHIQTRCRYLHPQYNNQGNFQAQPIDNNLNY